MAPKITKRILPKGRKYGRPGYKLKAPWSCTVHNTGNQKPGADAEAHAAYLESGRAISWHATADADSIVEHLPHDEQGWHTGTNAGNTTSEGIEICEYPDTKEGRALQAKATDNAAYWVALQHMKRGVKPSAKTIRTHESWSGKRCPRDILAAGAWPAFIAAVQKHYADLTGEKPKPKKWPGIVYGPTKVLVKAREAAVKWIQRQANKAIDKLGLKLAKLKPDGWYGAKTADVIDAIHKALKWRRNGGKTGKETWDYLARL